MTPGGAQETIAGLTPEPAARAPGPRVARVLPDVVGIDKEFDYLVPDGAAVHVGDVVRIALGPRRVGGWITALDVEPAPGRSLIALAKVSGRGPAADLVDLASWAAWRWAGRRAHFLRTASPPAVVRTLPAALDGSSSEAVVAPDHPVDPVVVEALAKPRGVLRLPPGADRYPLVLAACRAPSAVAGHTLVLCPSVGEARALGQRLRRDGVRTAVVAHDAGGAAGAGEWARARAGSVVVGARAAAWAPVAGLARVVVLDEHDEVYQEESSPTWHARDVVIERARRAGAPCLLVSPLPTLEALAWGELVVPPRGDERAGWPRVEVVDQRDLDPSLGPLFSPALVQLVRGEGRVLCVLNRTGRARLLACTACATLARCAVCEAAVGQVDPAAGGEAATAGVAELACGRCGTVRPMVCLACGGARFKNLRLGVSKAREELEVLAREPVAEVTGASSADDPALRSARLLIGTEAILHRVARADAVAFLDFDQELLALRYRAGEQALGMLARAGRLVRRGRGDRGRVLVQTRTPDHPALVAAVKADPGRLVEGEVPLRAALGLPPAMAMAIVSGQAAPAFVDALGSPAGVTIQGPVDGAWRLRAPTHQVLCDALAGVARPPGRLRLAVDPLGG